MMTSRPLLPFACLLLFAGCSVLERELPEDPAPLADMEEPLELHDEPEDEAARQALPAGSFTGVYATDSRTRMDQLEEDPVGVMVERVVENSPAAAAGIEDGDILLEARGPEPVGKRELSWPSEWRSLEIDAAPGAKLEILLDRAGREFEVELVTEGRVHVPDRGSVERFREEKHVGVVLRTATEVEARTAGLGPGGGAVVVGLSRGSPWRKAGLCFGDLLLEVDGEAVAHPQVVLDAIREAAERGEMALVIWRDGARRRVETLVSSRAGEVTEFRIPLLFSYESDRGKSETSVLLGFIGCESTDVAWRWRFLWFITCSGGMADRLVEVER